MPSVLMGYSDTYWLDETRSLTPRTVWSLERLCELSLFRPSMTPDQRRWLRRAKELAGGARNKFSALEPGNELVVSLVSHLNILLSTPEWHDVGTLDAFLKAMLPLADCCASLEARMPDSGQDYAQLAWEHLYLAGEVSTISRQLLVALDRRFKSGGPPALDLIKRLALSASVPVRWWPKALRVAAERELGETRDPAPQAAPTPSQSLPSIPPRCMSPLLFMAADAVKTVGTVMSLKVHIGQHNSMLSAILCTPATLATTLGSLAAVYARFACFPAAFKDQAKEWAGLAEIAGSLLGLPSNEAVAAAVEGNEDVQQQLAAALMPYAAHLLEVSDRRRMPWFEAWGRLVAALGAEAVWPNPEAEVDGRAVQLSITVQEGLLRLLRALPPLDKPPQSFRDAWGWATIPLNTTKAAAVAAAKALRVVDRMPQARVQQVAALRAVQQQGLSTLLALLPIAVDLLAAAAGQLAGPAAAAGSKPLSMSLAKHVYAEALEHLVLAAGDLRLDQELGLQAQPGELAAAGEAALRLAAQAAALTQPLGNSLGTFLTAAFREGVGLVIRISDPLLAAARQEVSAAPEAGGVRPSLQVQLHLVHTVCKFVRVTLAPGAPVGDVRTDELHLTVGQLLLTSNMLVFRQANEDKIPEGRAPLTPAEKRALLGAALALSAARSAVVHLLPEGQDRENQQISSLLNLCRLLLVPDLAGALLAQHAELAEQLVAGLAAITMQAANMQAAQAEAELDDCFGAVILVVNDNRRLGPLMLCGASGEALEAAARQGLQASGDAAAQGQHFWTDLLATLIKAAESCFDSNGREAAERLLTLLQNPEGVQELQQENWEALRAVRAAADGWLAQEAQQQSRQEQLLLCAEAAATRACSNLACTNLGGASEAGLKAKLCSGCCCARYCSTACQREDWRAGHKAVCKRMQARQVATRSG